ncbi:efflux transporter outer membrane subunit [Polynucleobacter sp. AP-RePozz3-80-G7]|jgi:NodT family efflux transporter outer membrane factor (OMF) lipoprotein|uniref:efflux transporter outer membrane subunit n=1 Tax=Polynucleobacter sp. AP-RePozz3-80-G7 TaxID=2689105 RepID=UPI001BFE3E9F|nr:efflux transporter outer membrane subunit [Polynucleobacter sp. AP-RePozz3-80-G7]MBU3638109.1 efflux transporter outer membrane subunit [Polynucleobacter sp. AP-RePozz3-80-G7]QWD81509.1 efflux transporter outer membrane subunit [Polynucleobacter sp. MWH-S4W17]
MFLSIPHLSGLKLLPLICALALSACAVGPDFKQPEAPNTSSYTETPLAKKLATAPGVPGGTDQEFVEGADIGAQWWELYKSPELDALIKRALEQNPNLGAADAALRAAQENVNAQIGGQYFPAIGVGANAIRQKQPSAVYGMNYGSDTYNLYNATVNVTYKLDVFGGARRAVEGARAQAEVAQFQLEGAYLSLTANVVTSAVKEAALRAQMQATEEILKAQTNLAEVTEKQLIIGTVSRVDVTSQRTLVSNSQVDLFNYERNLAFARNQLAVLVGEIPSNANIAKFDLANLHLPEKLPLSVPSSLVRQRPDVRAAEAQLKAQNAFVGVATANLLPQFNITGSIGAAALTSSGLFGPNSALWSLGGGILQPLFQGGALLAQRRGAIANYELAAFQYQATVLNAFQEVANALRALETGAQALKAASDAERYAYETLDLVQQQYKLGTASYLAVLYYQNQYQQAKVKSVAAQATRFSDTAALFAALGGGWWNREGPAFKPKDIANKDQNETSGTN